MIERHDGRRHTLRPNERDTLLVKRVLAVFTLLAAVATLTLLLFSGFHNGLMSLSLPAYRMLARAARAGHAELKPAMRADQSLRISEAEAIYASLEVLSPSRSVEPQILVYHTHATEAYLQNEQNRYAESGKWRTEDTKHSVVAVGALLAQTLREDYGLGVLHDTRNYEPPKLSTAYSRSLNAMRAYQREYPSLRIFIDVHRDAYGTALETDTEPRDFVPLDGKELARIMFVVGTGEGATGAGFDERPDFQANLSFAEAVTEALSDTDKRLTRDIRIKTGRYNQHVSSRCLLVEVGHNANTLEQALASVPYLAAALHSVIDAELIETASPPEMDVWTP